MAEMLGKMDPNMYCNFGVVEKGKKVLYTYLQKVLYGLLKA